MMTITAVLAALVLLVLVARNKLSKTAQKQAELVLDLNKDGKLNVKDAEVVLDLNKDGKLDIKDAQIALDLNNDGKVDVKDLKIAKTELKKAATQINKLNKKVK